MSENAVQQNGETDLFAKVISYLKVRFKSIFFRGVISLIVTVLLLTVLWAFSPRKVMYSQDVMLMLPKGEKTFSYPDGTEFSTADLISPSVLNEIYRECKLQERMPENDFQKIFMVVNSDIERTLLDAEYREKMAKRNISLVDLRKLQDEYTNKIDALPKNRFSVMMNAEVPFSFLEAQNILSKIPVIWFKQYSVLHSEPLPPVENLAAYDPASVSGNLLQLERAYLYCRNLQEHCKQLDDQLAKNRNFAAKTGETLSDLLHNLQQLERFELSLLRQYIQCNAKLQQPADKLFVQSRVSHIRQELLRENELRNNVVNIINTIRSNTAVSAPAGTQNTPVATTAVQQDATLQLDSAFLTRYGALVQKTAAQNLIVPYLEKMEKSSDKIAALNAENLYFDMFLKAENTAPVAEITPEKFQEMLKKANADLIAAGKKVDELQNYLQTHALSSDYFVSDGYAKEVKNLSLPIKLIAVGLIAIWMLFNIIVIVIDFYKFGEKENA